MLEHHPVHLEFRVASEVDQQTQPYFGRLQVIPLELYCETLLMAISCSAG